MHYSRRMQNEIDELKLQLYNARQEVIAFRAHLVTPKFHGDGNDYIQTCDVDARLLQLQQVLM